MIIEKNKPLLAVDWSKVSHVRVTLEAKYNNGGLRWRQGTTDAKKNLSYNAHDDSAGPPYWPGAPIMYPDEGPAVVGTESASFVMPASAAFTAFGHWFAPLEVPRAGLLGFTLRAERERVALFWGWYKMPKGDGTMHPPMNRIGAPNIPRVAITPLDRNFKPLALDGEEVVIRPWEFFEFDNPQMYDEDPNAKAGGNADVAAILSGFTGDEIDGLRELLKVKSGKQKVT